MIDHERSPLVTGATRRRTGPASQQHLTEHTPFLSATRFVPPSPSTEDDHSKDHGRKPLGRIITAVSSIFQSQGRRNSRLSGSTTTVNGGHEYYRENFNEYNWSCTFGTGEEDGTWINRDDPPGTILSMGVWVLILYSGITVTLLAQAEHIPPIVAMIYCTLTGMSLASHGKTMFTDPGSVPDSAVPIESISRTTTHTMCSQCQTFKPPSTHHCRICNRCISRMDHHCPWMNNCIGAGNIKHFILFLFYTWLSATFALLTFGWNYFLCSDEECTFSTVLIQLVRVMTVLCIGVLLFTSSMLMNVVYGLMTGIGTVDRLKKKRDKTMSEAIEEPISLKDVFGVEGYITWLFPIDPIFEDFDRAMGYCTTQRLLREQLIENPNAATSNYRDKVDYAPA